MGAVPKPGEAGRVPRASYAAGDEIVIRYSEPGGMTRSSPIASPGTKLVKEPETVTEADDKMTVAPARVNLKTVFRDPVKTGKSGGKLPAVSKSYKTKKRPVAPASEDGGAAEKKPRVTAKDDRPGKKVPTAAEKLKTSKPLLALSLGKSSAPVVDLALSDSEDEDDEDTC